MALHTFCCCGNLRTGSLIIGFTELIFAGISLVVSFGNLVELPHNVDYITSKNYFAIAHASYFYFGYAVACVLTYAAVIYGTNKKKRTLLLPYLILNAISTFLVISFFLILIILLAFSWSRIPEANLIIILCTLSLSLIYAVVKIYFWMIIFSYYKEISSDKQFSTVCIHTSENSEENPNRYSLGNQKLII